MPDTLEYLHPATIVPLLKADVDRDGRKPVMLRASSEERDRQGEVVLLKCFDSNRPMLRQFEQTGYLDWNHETDIYEREIREIVVSKGSAAEISRLQTKKHEAIIGEPMQCGLRDDFPAELGLKDDGFYCKASLYPDNSHSQTIIKNLSAGATIYGASISARAPKGAVRGGKVHALSLRKIAIQPRLDSVNQDTWVSLTKAALLSDAVTDADETPVEKAGEEYDLTAERFMKIESCLDRIETRQLAHSRLILTIPRVQDAIADEISRAIKAKELRLNSAEIRSYLSRSYDFAPLHAEEIADYILIKYGATK